MKPLRFGIVGIGNIGGMHAENLYSGKIVNACLAALCDSDDDKIQYYKERYHLPVYSDYRELIASGTVDAVIVSVPHPMHGEIAIAAMRAGLSVLCEKPVAVSVSEAVRMNEEADRSGVTFGIMFNQRMNPLFQKARELVRTGAIGKRQRLTWVVTNWYRTQAYYDSGSWRATWRGEGGGVLLNQAVHNLDMLQWIFGMPKTVSAVCREGQYHAITVEDYAAVYGRYEDGAEMQFITSTGEYPGTNRLEIVGDRGKMVLEEGKIKLWRLQESTEAVSASSWENMPAIVYTFEEFTPDRPDKAHCGIIENFVSAVLYQTPLLADGREGIHQLMLTNAAYLSAWQDKTVTLPIDGAEFDRYHTEKRNGEGEKSQGTASSGGGDGLPRWQVNW